MQRKPLPKPSKDNKQVQEYTRAVKRGRDSHLVVPTDRGWSVRKPAASRASGNFSTKSDAVAYARKSAASSRSDVVVFSKNGKTASFAPRSSKSSKKK